jgi:hypothetical protein
MHPASARQDSSARRASLPTEDISLKGRTAAATTANATADAPSDLSDLVLALRQHGDRLLCNLGAADRPHESFPDATASSYHPPPDHHRAFAFAPAEPRLPPTLDEYRMRCSDWNRYYYNCFKEKERELWISYQKLHLEYREYQRQRWEHERSMIHVNQVRLSETLGDPRLLYRSPFPYTKTTRVCLPGQARSSHARLADDAVAAAAASSAQQTLPSLREAELAIALRESSSSEQICLRDPSYSPTHPSLEVPDDKEYDIESPEYIPGVYDCCSAADDAKTEEDE